MADIMIKAIICDLHSEALNKIPEEITSSLNREVMLALLAFLPTQRDLTGLGPCRQ
jgi:hypothetical protein